MNCNELDVLARSAFLLLFFLMLLVVIKLSFDHIKNEREYRTSRKIHRDKMEALISALKDEIHKQNSKKD